MFANSGQPDLNTTLGMCPRFNAKLDLKLLPDLPKKTENVTLARMEHERIHLMRSIIEMKMDKKLPLLRELASQSLVHSRSLLCTARCEL